MHICSLLRDFIDLNLRVNRKEVLRRRATREWLWTSQESSELLNFYSAFLLTCQSKLIFPSILFVYQNIFIYWMQHCILIVTSCWMNHRYYLLAGLHRALAKVAGCTCKSGTFIINRNHHGIRWVCLQFRNFSWKRQGMHSTIWCLFYH